MIENTNWVAVLVAAIASFVVGGLWYSPILFGKRWMAAMNMSPDHKPEGAAKAYAMSFIGSILMAFVLWHVLRFYDVSSWLQGAQAGFWMWFGFILPVSVNEMLFEKKNKNLTWINSTHYLAGLIVAGIVLVIMM